MGIAVDLVLNPRYVRSCVEMGWEIRILDKFRGG